MLKTYQTADAPLDVLFVMATEAEYGAALRREIAPVASLYVNEWNTPARRAYERVGFRESARFSTVMF